MNLCKRYQLAIDTLASRIITDSSSRDHFDLEADRIAGPIAWLAELLQTYHRSWILRRAHRAWLRMQRAASPAAPMRLWSCACCAEEVVHLDGVLGRRPVQHLCPHAFTCSRAADALPACLDCRAAYVERQRLDVAGLPTVDPGQVIVLLATGEAVRAYARAQEHGVAVSLARAGGEHATLRARPEDLDVLVTGQRLVKIARRSQRGASVVHAARAPLNPGDSTIHAARESQNCARAAAGGAL